MLDLCKMNMVSPVMIMIPEIPHPSQDAYLAFIQCIRNSHRQKYYNNGGSGLIIDLLFLVMGMS